VRARDAVYQDYLNRAWDRYFSERFVFKHLRPHEVIPLPESRGGPAQHRAARERAREGNLHLIARAQHGLDAEKNTLILDIDRHRGVRQVLNLMREVETRNRDGYYASRDRPAYPQTLGSYYIHTTGHGSRQWFGFKPFSYGIILVGETRYIINHFHEIVR
jgi:hypothetical protein